MLSAIAARKAAQAAKQHQPQANGDEVLSDTQRPSPLSSSSESELDLSSPAHPRQKRKAQDTESPRKKRQKRKSRLTNADIGRTRYFEAQQPIEGFDDEESAIPANSVPTRAYSPSQHIPNVELIHDEYLDPVSETVGQRRGFSPSRPVPDSSEDEDQLLDDLATSGDQGNVLPSEKNQTPPRPTFNPGLDSNTFRLTNAELASLQLPSDTAHSNGATLILLSPRNTLTFVGTAYITLLQGAITILGTPLTPSLCPHRIFSPRSSPLASLEALSVQSGAEDPVVSLLQPSQPNGGILPQRILSAIGTSDSVVVVQRLQTGVEGLGRVFRTFDGAFDVDDDVREAGAEDVIGIEGFHPVSPYTRPHPQLQPFSLPDSWGKALGATVPSLSSADESASATQNTSFIALVRGPKKCGKSTFARTLVNRLTTRYRHVAFLECDLGQSEFTPGGIVSLHVISNPVFGPPFTHPKHPFRAHYIGHTTPRSSPSHYLSCIQALVQTYRMDVQYAYSETSSNPEFCEDMPGSCEHEHDNRIEAFVPLVVNTQGWIKGLGGDLLRKIEEIVQATNVFELDVQASVIPRQRIHQPSAAHVHMLQPILTSPLAAYYTAADHRSLAILSYFHYVFRSGTGIGHWSTDLSLCARPPWEVNCREAIDQIVLVGAGYEDVVSHELDRALNCGVVALVCDEDLMADPSDKGDSTISFPYTQGAPAPSPSTSYCIGLALVRGVDPVTSTLHILTPLPPVMFARCRVLVKGELELPVWGMLDFRDGQVDGVAGIPWEKVPYLQMGARGAGAVGAGAGRKRVRRNLMRRGQM